MPSSVATALSAGKRVALISHVRPDGDAVGSVLAMAEVVRQLGSVPIPVLRDGVPPAFHFLEGHEEVVAVLPEDCDLCIVLDAPDSARTGFRELVRAYGEAGKLALIDHHQVGDLLRRATTTLHDGTASSTAELVYILARELGTRLTSTLSTALLTGMYTDTGGFQYGNSRNTTLTLASELLRRGARLDRIVQHIARQRSTAGLRLLGLALSRLTLTSDRKGVVTVLALADLEACSATPEDAAGMVNSLNVLPEVAYCLFLSELESGTVRGTLRTTDGSQLDVARLAGLFGGGGHPRAAGFALPGHLTVTPTGWRIEPPLVS